MINALLARSDELLKTAIAAAIDQGGVRLDSVLQDLPAPIYLTDPEGVITFYNKACVGFAGRRPAVGKDRWCVSWKLFTEDGEFLPHDQCPMAQAIRSQRPVRGMFAVAKRPDGTRVTFTPLPTPLFDHAGELIGAVNLLIVVTEIRQIEELRNQSERCRRLAHSVSDQSTTDTLCAMAAECDHKAGELEASFLRTRTLN